MEIYLRGVELIFYLTTAVQEHETIDVRELEVLTQLELGVRTVISVNEAQQ